MWKGISWIFLLFLITFVWIFTEFLMFWVRTIVCMEVSRGSDFSRSVWISAQIRLMWTNPNYFEDIPSTSCRNNFVTLKCFVSYMRRCKSINNKRTKERPYAQVQLVSLSSKLRRYIDYCVVICREMSLIWGVSQANFYLWLEKKC